MDLAGLSVDAPVARPDASRGARVLLALAVLLVMLAALACGGNGRGPAATASATAPRTASFAPTSGVAGTTTVTLQGAGFTGFTAVRFGDVAVASAKGDGDGRITVQVPPGAVTGPITVVTPGGSHTHPEAFTVLPAPAPAPAVTGFQPSAGAPGTPVVLSGTGFTGVSQVAFGGAAAPIFLAEDGTRLLAVVPAGAASGPVTVWTPAGSTSSQATFTVLPAPIPHRLPPSVTGFTPLQGAPGTVVVLTGTHLGDAFQVDFGGLASPQFNPQDDQTLVAYVPQGAVSGTLTVATPAGTGASTATFTVTAAPALGVTGLQPALGAPGEVVTVTGAGFTGATQVTFGGVAAPLVDVKDDATLVAVVPDGAVTGPVGVLAPGGVHFSPTPFTVNGGAAAPVAGLPVITQVVPANGPVGTDVFIGGTGLLGTTEVAFGPAAALGFQALSDTVLLAVVPPGARTGPVTVANSAGLAVAGPFAVDPPAPVPVPTRFNPATGTPGTQVVIQGTDLDGLEEVTFGGFAADRNSLGVTAGGDLLVTVPPLAVSGPIVVVTAAGHGASAGDFAVVPPAPPLATGFLQASGKPGDIATLTGANLDLVQAVQFSTGAAGVLSTTDRIQSLAGGTRLEVAVPPDAATGPVFLAINGNPVVVPGGAFAVSSAVPVITGINPARGIPGTEVALTGDHLLQVDEVAFAGAALDPARVTVVSDQEVRVRIPDQGEAGSSGALAVHTPAGIARAGEPVTFDPARATVLNQRVERTPYDPAGLVLVDFPEVRRAAPYGLQLPQAPVFHPLTPRSDPPSRPDAPNPSFLLNLRLPAPFYPALPEIVRRQLAHQGLDPANVEIYLEAQHNVWDADALDGPDDPTAQYEFHPHYWVYPDAPAAGGFPRASFLQVGLVEPATGGFQPMSLRGVAEDALATQLIWLGPDGDGGAVQALGGRVYLDGVHHDESYAFWSIARLNERAAVTLHLLLNDADQALVAASTADLGLLTLGMVLRNLAAEPTFSLGTALTYLARPMVTGVTVRPQGDLDEVTLQGDLLGPSPLIWLDGAEQPAGNVTVVSGAMVKVLVTTGAEGEIEVQTDLGKSEPVRLDRPDPRNNLIP